MTKKYCKDCIHFSSNEFGSLYYKQCMHANNLEIFDTPEAVVEEPIFSIKDINGNNNCIFHLTTDAYIGFLKIFQPHRFNVKEELN